MGKLEAKAFDLLLAAVGLLLTGASRFRPRLRAQITRNLVIDISSDDGVARRYRFHAKTRTITMEPVNDRPPDAALRFGRARDGLRAFISTKTIKRVARGMNYGETRMDGNPTVVLWFHGITRTVVPIGSTRRPRRRDLPPIGVRDPEMNAPWATRITREPVLGQLDPTWRPAWEARAKLLQLRAADGEPLPPG